MSSILLLLVSTTVLTTSDSASAPDWAAAFDVAQSEPVSDPNVSAPCDLARCGVAPTRCGCEADVVVTEWDHDRDGLMDVRQEDTFNREGWPLGHRMMNSAGADVLTTYQYDPQGNLLVWSSDDRADGVLESQHVHTYDEQGHELTQENWLNGNLFVRFHFTYDERGRKISEGFDYGADGTIDRVDSWAYADGDNWTVEEVDSDADGHAEMRMTRTYDSDGNLIQRTLDTDNDGAIDESCVYNPPCPPPFACPDCR